MEFMDKRFFDEIIVKYCFAKYKYIKMFLFCDKSIYAVQNIMLVYKEGSYTLLRTSPDVY